MRVSYFQAADQIDSLLHSGLDPSQLSTTLLFLTDGEARIIPSNHAMFAKLQTRKQGGAHAKSHSPAPS